MRLFPSFIYFFFLSFTPIQSKTPGVFNQALLEYVFHVYQRSTREFHVDILFFLFSFLLPRGECLRNVREKLKRRREDVKWQKWENKSEVKFSYCIFFIFGNIEGSNSLNIMEEIDVRA